MQKLVLAVIVLFSVGVTFASDWNQWRGAARDGVASDSPPLIDALPAEGLKPVWISEAIPSARLSFHSPPRALARG